MKRPISCRTGTPASRCRIRPTIVSRSSVRPAADDVSRCWLKAASTRARNWPVTSTPTSVEVNAYTLRLRQAYATLDKKDGGTSLLGGPAWSLLTLFNGDMTPRREQIPLTIDAQYVPGFTYTRNPQLRVVQHFDDM